MSAYDEIEHIALELFRHFPELDLQFTFLEEFDLLSCWVPEYSEEPIELDLSEADPEVLLHQAIFEVKEITRSFDA